MSFLLEISRVVKLASKLSDYDVRHLTSVCLPVGQFRMVWQP